jgi:hypothetical protein
MLRLQVEENRENQENHEKILLTFCDSNRPGVRGSHSAGARLDHPYREVHKSATHLPQWCVALLRAGRARFTIPTDKNAFATSSPIHLPQFSFIKIQSNINDIIINEGRKNCLLILPIGFQLLCL